MVVSPDGLFSYNSLTSSFSISREPHHTNADSLSHCLPVPVTFISELKLLEDPTSIHKAQEVTFQLRTVTSALVQRKPPTNCAAGLHSCFLSDGVLCRHYTSSTTGITHTQVVVPSSLRSEVLYQLHNRAGHLGVKCATDTVKTRF